MSLTRKITSFFPKGFLWRLTFLNSLIITVAITVCSWAIYNVACFLVEGMGNFDVQRQQQFNATLFNYLWIFITISVIAGSLLHFYLIKRLIKPIRNLTKSTEQMKRGDYPNPVPVSGQDEIGQLVEQYNSLIQQLQLNDQHREKLVSDLSHEFRTPLANLKGYLHALKQGDVKGNETLYQSLYQESERLMLMVEQLEQLKEWNYVSSQSITKRQIVQITEVVDQCVAMFEWTLKKAQIPIQVDADPSELPLHVEGVQQVISNLLDNAIRYDQSNSPIVVKGERIQDSYRISIAGFSELIPETDKENIFKRFYRVESSRSRDKGGSGLGLAIAKEIVDRHNGMIGVDTDHGKNVFWFTLPIE
ncbi:sensor histidine kinase [Virgibacillus byunsanensis]|uniref:histidine kinase n=1 Tax=Virgibacillus byunsanensis TaxID=570945 RepID=A0ABW3LNK0_9BACI